MQCQFNRLSSSNRIRESQNYFELRRRNKNRKPPGASNTERLIIDFSYQVTQERYNLLNTQIISRLERPDKGRIFYTLF